MSETQAAPAEKKDEKKKSPVEKVWRMVGMVIAGGVGAVVLVSVAGPLAGMVVSAFGSGVAGISQAMLNAAIQLSTVSASIRVFGTGISGVVMTILMYAILIVGVVAISQWIMASMGKKDDKSH